MYALKLIMKMNFTMLIPAAGVSPADVEKQLTEEGKAQAAKAIADQWKPMMAEAGAEVSLDSFDVTLVEV